MAKIRVEYQGEKFVLVPKGLSNYELLCGDCEGHVATIGVGTRPSEMVQLVRDHQGFVPLLIESNARLLGLLVINTGGQ